MNLFTSSANMLVSSPKTAFGIKFETKDPAEITGLLRQALASSGNGLDKSTFEVISIKDGLVVAYFKRTNVARFTSEAERYNLEGQPTYTLAEFCARFNLTVPSGQIAAPVAPVATEAPAAVTIPTKAKKIA